LDKCFVLTADIDLSSYDNWKPIGSFVPISDAPEDEETPVLELTFTGVFDGGGHKISNIKIDEPERAAVGLFGCIAGDAGSVLNLTVENADVRGAMLVAGVVGYDRGPIIRNVRLIGDNDVKGGFLVGGIVGGGFCDTVDCEAQANVTLFGDGAQGVGVLAGGMETCDIIDCSATGRVTVTGTDCMSIGGLSGAAHNSENVLRCVSDVVITVGEGNMMIGGLLGHAGMEESAGDTPTLISDCSATAVITAPASAERIGGIVGGGFFTQAYREYRPEPGANRVVDCVTAGEISGGKIVGAIIGYAYDNSTLEGCASTMTANGASDLIGATSDQVPLDELR
jgi:hypothetical protein